MSSEDHLWYRLGYVLERGRERPGGAGALLSGLAERVRDARDALPGAAKKPLPSRPSSDQLLAAGLSSVAGRLLGIWPARHPTGVRDLLKAGACGAAAAILVHAGRSWLAPDVRDTGDENDEASSEAQGTEQPGPLAGVLTGIAQGLVYSAVWEPRVPGPAPLKGALYGAAEYAVGPIGGLSALFGRATPQGRVPILGKLLSQSPGGRDSVLEHVVFGVVMGVFYGAGADRSRISSGSEGA